jgi:hypothetical protein
MGLIAFGKRVFQGAIDIGISRSLFNPTSKSELWGASQYNKIHMLACWIFISTQKAAGAPRCSPRQRTAEIASIIKLRNSYN